MTCIVNFNTKKELKEYLANHGDCHIVDPGILSNYRGSAKDYIKANEGCVVTNHPKRSWFASLTIDKNGKVKAN